VSCAASADHVFTMGNGPVGPDGQARLMYSIENVRRGELCQNEDTVALPPGATIKGLFWSDVGVSFFPFFCSCFSVFSFFLDESINTC